MTEKGRKSGCASTNGEKEGQGQRGGEGSTTDVRCSSVDLFFTP